LKEGEREIFFLEKVRIPLVKINTFNVSNTKRTVLWKLLIFTEGNPTFSKSKNLPPHFYWNCPWNNPIESTDWGGEVDYKQCTTLRIFYIFPIFFSFFLSRWTNNSPTWGEKWQHNLWRKNTKLSQHFLTIFPSVHIIFFLEFQLSKFIACIEHVPWQFVILHRNSIQNTTKLIL